MLGATNQMVTKRRDDWWSDSLQRYDEKVSSKIAVLSRFPHKHGYWVWRVDVLENAEGQMFVIDANIRITVQPRVCCAAI